jgi:hypothetical protein
MVYREIMYQIKVGAYMMHDTHYRMTFLQHFMNRYKSLKCLNFVHEDRLDFKSTPK